MRGRGILSLALSVITLGGLALACGWLTRGATPTVDGNLQATRTALGLTQTAVAQAGAVQPASPSQPQGQVFPVGLNLPVVPWGLLTQPKGSHVVRPAEPGPALSAVQDRATGDQVRPGQPVHPGGGDTYQRNIYERPFKENTQDEYYPDLDITEARLSMDETWVYVDIEVYGLNPGAQTPTGNYGVELDLDRDGRGDLLVWVQGPVTDTQWTDARVQVYDDPNEDVGAARACLSDAPFQRTGYDRLIFYEARGQDPDMAWVRWVPPTDAETRPRIQFAFKRSLLPDPTKFVWWVWSDAYVAWPAFMDYHDAFLFPRAGSPYPEHPYYPVKALARMDNTCRVPFGFTPTEEDYTCGICLAQGEHPPDPPDSPPGSPPGSPPDKSTCPFTPKGPPGEPPAPNCRWNEETAEWWCTPSVELPRPDDGPDFVELCTLEGARAACVEREPLPGGEASTEAPLVMVEEAAGEETGGFSPLPREVDPSAFDLPEDLVKIRCRWNDLTCEWDCDDACLPSLDDLRAACSDGLLLRSGDLLGDGSAFWMCAQGDLFDPSEPPRTTRIDWDAGACTWKENCLLDLAPLVARARARLSEGWECMPLMGTWSNVAATLTRLGFEPEGLLTGGGPAFGGLMAFGLVCAQGDPARGMEEATRMEACVLDGCDINCQEKEPPRKCPKPTSEPACDGTLVPVPDDPNQSVCYIDRDRDGQGLEAYDPDDTYLLNVWNPETCRWEGRCLSDPEKCPPQKQCPMPPNGPACDFVTQLQDGSWICRNLEVTRLAPPQLCTWDAQACQWDCRDLTCQPPPQGPGPNCQPGEQPNTWVCTEPPNPPVFTHVPPPSGPVTYTWDPKNCAWVPLPPEACEPPQDLQTAGTDPLTGTPNFCQQRDDGQWSCPERGTFDECTWKVFTPEEQEKYGVCGRWVCWNLCEVDTNGPDNCKQVIHLGGNTWACIRETKNLTCTFNTDPNVCQWQCDLKCEIPSSPPPACTYKYQQLGPGYWECYDQNNNVTRWRYDLTQCQWQQE